MKLSYLYRAYRYRYRVDPAELRFVCSRLHAGQVAVDIGCHKGAYTYWMRRRVGAGGSVVAFEPQPRQVTYLQTVFATMRYENVALVPMAVSDVVGELPLIVPEHSTHAARLEGRRGVRRGERGVPFDSRCTLVPVTTLDAFFEGLPRGPDFLKIDVEGHESAVLEGARTTLARHRPAILVECEARHRADGDVRGVFPFLESLGYTGSFFFNGKRRPLAEFDGNVHQRLGGGAHELPPGYANNFAFEPT